MLLFDSTGPIDGLAPDAGGMKKQRSMHDKSKARRPSASRSKNAATLYRTL